MSFSGFIIHNGLSFFFGFHARLVFFGCVVGCFLRGNTFCNATPLPPKTSKRPIVSLRGISFALGPPVRSRRFKMFHHMATLERACDRSPPTPSSLILIWKPFAAGLSVSSNTWHFRARDILGFSGPVSGVRDVWLPTYLGGMGVYRFREVVRSFSPWMLFCVCCFGRIFSCAASARSIGNWWQLLLPRRCVSCRFACISLRLRERRAFQDAGRNAVPIFLFWLRFGIQVMRCGVLALRSDV